MATHFGRIKNVDQTTQHIVSGFIRSTEMLFTRNLNIPPEIALMCLLYYYNPEYFTVHGSNMILKHNGQTVESNYYSSKNKFESTAYGNLEINAKDYIKCIWNFEIKKQNENVAIAIGIAINKCIIDEIFVDPDAWLTFENDDMEEETHYNYGYY
eukprot:383021_1